LAVSPARFEKLAITLFAPTAPTATICPFAQVSFA
jgi:hypothetical protein